MTDHSEHIILCRKALATYEAAMLLDTEASRAVAAEAAVDIYLHGKALRAAATGEGK